MLCSLEAQRQQCQAFVKNIKTARMYEGDLFFCRKGGVIPPPPQLIMLLGAAWSIAASSGSSLGAGCKPGKSSLEESKE